MPIVNITTWPTPSNIKKTLMEKITKLIHEESGAPLDKITVYFQEIDKNNWSEAGTLGSDESFPVNSRRQQYETTEVK